jgi:poly-D-alanine transfer protein DltD
MQTPKLFANDPLVALAAHALAEDGTMGRLRYLAALPLGKLHTASLELKDCWATLSFLQNEQRTDTQITRRPTGIDWPTLTHTAEAEQWNAASNNEFGFDNAVWEEKYRRLVAERRGQFSDDWFIDNLQHNAEFTDLSILLRGLAEMGADTLLITQPIPGKYYDYVGVSAGARGEFYARLRDIAATYNVPLVDFADHDGDIYFVTDPNSHLSRKGWTYYDRALDAFYHGNLDELARSEWSAAALLPGDSARFAAFVR